MYKFTGVVTSKHGADLTYETVTPKGSVKEKVYLLVYDSESDCDGIIGVYKRKENAIQAAVEINTEIHHEDCEETGYDEVCDCRRTRSVDSFCTKSMDWGPALRVGPSHYVVEKDLH